MINSTYKGLALCFFNANRACDRTVYDNFQSHATSYASYQLESAKKELAVSHIILAKQVHGDAGIIIDSTSLATHLALQSEADYLVTDVPGIGLGIYTADCLPLICFDTQKKVIGLAHAGWPGTTKNIATKTIYTMKDYFSSRLEDIEVYFGPSCRPCCYQVGPEFLEKLVKDYSQEVVDSLIRVDARKQLFFDLPGLNHWQLVHAGIKKESIHLQYNQCTICHTQYCSYRRDRDLKRQITAIALDMT